MKTAHLQLLFFHLTLVTVGQGHEDFRVYSRNSMFFGSWRKQENPVESQTKTRLKLNTDNTSSTMLSSVPW